MRVCARVRQYACKWPSIKHTHSSFCRALVVPLQVGGVVRTPNMRNGANKESVFFLLAVHTQHISGNYQSQTGLLLNTWQKSHLHNRALWARRMNSDNISKNRQGCCTDDKAHTPSHTGLDSVCASALNNKAVGNLENWLLPASP